MIINRADRTSFYRDFYAVDVAQDGTAHVHVRTLNIFQRALRYLFGAYSNTIWNESKSRLFKQDYPVGWNIVVDTIQNPDQFTAVFKIKRTYTPVDRAIRESSSIWKKFGRDQLRTQLTALGLTFKESKENGDCFFDSVAYLLTKIKGDRQYSAQDVRTGISDYINSDSAPHARYRELLSTVNFEKIPYESYQANIGRCAAEDYTPIWGDAVAMQIVCDLYNVKITTYSLFLADATILDTLNGGSWEDCPFVNSEEYQKNYTIHVSTKELAEKNFAPIDERPNPQVPEHTLLLGTITRGVWGHILPVVRD